LSELRDDRPSAMTPTVPPSVHHFDALFDGNDDPWQFRSRWYEARKRALTLACLPQQRYASGFEPGCANGELSAALAMRCDQLLATDGSARAVALARERTAALPHVHLQQAWVPDDWPDATFDLIVISELGYFLSADALTTLITKTRTCLRRGGTVLACHWRRGSDDCALDGDEVHRRLAKGLALPHLCELVDLDMRIDVWSDNPRSVAQHEGFV
jgi:cyclopropane fatty-acyl-phospholipid synthase-like methyltransferase